MIVYESDVQRNHSAKITQFSQVDAQLRTFADLAAVLHRGGAYRFFWTAEGDDTRDKRHSHYNRTTTPARPPAQWADRHGVFFSVHPHTTPRKRHEAGTTDTVAAINSLYAEFDGKDFIDRAEWMPFYVAPDLAGMDDRDKLKTLTRAQADAIEAAFLADTARYKARALAHVETIEPAPSALWDSGGGYQAVWLLFDTIPVDDDNRAHLAAVQKGWVSFVGGDPGAADLRRVLRTPGTLPKAKYAPAVTLVEFVDCNLERRYTFERLAGMVQIDEEQPPKQPIYIPDGVELEPPGAVPRLPRGPVVEAFNRAHNLRDMLLAYGYTPTRQNDRLSRPGADTGGVSLHADGTAVIFSSADPLFCGHRVTPADAFTVFEHAGNVESALSAMAARVGMSVTDADIHPDATTAGTDTPDIPAPDADGIVVLKRIEAIPTPPPLTVPALTPSVVDTLARELMTPAATELLGKIPRLRNAEMYRDILIQLVTVIAPDKERWVFAADARWLGEKLGKSGMSASRNLKKLDAAGLIRYTHTPTPDSGTPLTWQDGRPPMRVDLQPLVSALWLNVTNLKTHEKEFVTLRHDKPNAVHKTYSGQGPHADASMRTPYSYAIRRSKDPKVLMRSLSPSALTVLAFLHTAAGDGFTRKEIKEATGMTPGSVAGATRILEQLALVDTEVDGRTKIFSICTQWQDRLQSLIPDMVSAGAKTRLIVRHFDERIAYAEHCIKVAGVSNDMLEAIRAGKADPEDAPEKAQESILNWQRLELGRKKWRAFAHKTGAFARNATEPPPWMGQSEAKAQAKPHTPRGRAPLPPTHSRSGIATLSEAMALQEQLSKTFLTAVGRDKVSGRYYIQAPSEYSNLEVVA